MNTQDKIRVLIADDSFFMRSFLAELLRAQAHMEVVGTASTGEEVVELAHKLKPDVITMDYHMPVLNGIEATAAIMLGERPLPAILMISAFAGPDGEEVRHKLELSGAHVVVKPSGEVSLDIEKVGADIIKKVEEAGLIEVRMRKTFDKFHNKKIPAHNETRTFGTTPRGVVVIGASTGGPPLVEHLLATLRPDEGIAVLIVQHMSKYFTQLFSERLDRVTEFAVREVRNGDLLRSGEALVVPGGFALGYTDEEEGSASRLMLLPRGHGHPEDDIDIAMQTIAHCYHGKVVGVLLSGMGGDGAVGLAEIQKHGGYTIIQDPKTATLSAMPSHALLEGSGDRVLPLEEITPLIRKHFGIVDVV